MNTPPLISEAPINRRGDCRPLLTVEGVNQTTRTPRCSLYHSRVVAPLLRKTTEQATQTDYMSVGQSTDGPQITPHEVSIKYTRGRSRWSFSLLPVLYKTPDWEYYGALNPPLWSSGSKQLGRPYRDWNHQSLNQKWTALSQAPSMPLICIISFHISGWPQWHIGDDFWSHHHPRNRLKIAAPVTCRNLSSYNVRWRSIDYLAMKKEAKCYE